MKKLSAYALGVIESTLLSALNINYSRLLIFIEQSIFAPQYAQINIK